VKLKATFELQWRTQMDRLDNEEIGIIWARHYPKRAENGSSKSLCLSLAMVIRLRARSMTQQSDWSNKLEHILADARIPKEQFTTIENESTWIRLESAHQTAGGFYSTKLSDRTAPVLTASLPRNYGAEDTEYDA